MRIVKNWVFATFILTFLVIIAGAVVRTTQSGMGCPDWPRCFGKWIPPTNASELPPDFEKYLSKQDIDHSFNAFQFLFRIHQYGQIRDNVCVLWTT